MDIEKNLAQFGFDKREVAIYLALLSGKDMPAHAVAKATSIPRTTVYKSLEDLERRGFVSSWSKNGVKHFSPESPKRLKELSDMKAKALDEAMPQLMGLFRTDVVYPTAKLYLGRDGVKQAFEIILETIQDRRIKQIYVYSDYELTQLIPRYFREWRVRKNATKTFTHLIVPYGTPMNEDYSSNEFRETRVMPKEFSFMGSVDITDSLVSFFSFKDAEPYAIVVDSPVVAEMLTKFFKYVWSTLGSDGHKG